MTPILQGPVVWGLVIIFAASEVFNQIAMIMGVRRSGKSWLIPWAPTLHFYFPLAAIAAYKGILELAWKPFYWDKTTHGILLPTSYTDVSLPPEQPQHPVSTV